MAALTTQPTNNPTRKLTAAIVATAVVAIAHNLVDIWWPDLFRAEVWNAIYPVVVWAAGYVVKDEATMVVVQTVTHETLPPAPEKPK